MKKQVLFLQGGGDNGYKTDKDLVARLKKELGEGYETSYPEIKADKAAPDFGWLKQIGHEIDKTSDDVILVAHSFGASMLLKFLSEQGKSRKTAGVFLLATPFWNGKEKWQEGIKLQEDLAESLPKNIGFFFFHCRDDHEISSDQMTLYRNRLPNATFCEIETGGHQFDRGLDSVARYIKGL